MSNKENAIPCWEQKSRNLCLQIEHLLYLVIGVGLLCTAILSVWNAVLGLLHIFEQGATFFSVIFHSVDNLLLALMFLEIFHTVEVVLKGRLHACIEPFLFVGIIASIRRILIISLQTAHAEAPQTAQTFQNAMIETAILGGLILILVAAVWVLRNSAKVQTDGSC